MPALLVQPRTAGAEKLRWGKYSPAYRKRLLEGCQALQSYLTEVEVPWESVIHQKASVVDEVLEQFIKHLHDKPSKSGLRIAKHAMLSFQIMRPRLRRKLQASWDAIKSWEEQQPSSFRAPVPMTLLMAITCQAVLNSEKSDSRSEARRWLALAVMVLTGFYGLLRPGELLNLRASDVVPPNSMSLGSAFSVVRIARPKNARQMGIQQYVEIRHPDAANWLAWLKSERQPEAALWNSTPHRFRSMFKSVCRSLNIESLRLSPASLRAGGATWLVDQGIEVSRVRFLGRWAHMRSLEHYLQVARAQQITLSIAPTIALQLKKFLMRFHFLVHLPAFLADQVPEENLLRTEFSAIPSPSHAIAGARAWGRLAEAVSQGGSQCGTLERCPVSRSQLGGPTEGSQVLQTRSQVLPICEEDDE